MFYKDPPLLNVILRKDLLNVILRKDLLPLYTLYRNVC